MVVLRYEYQFMRETTTCQAALKVMLFALCPFCLFSCPVGDLFIRANRSCGDLLWCSQRMSCVLFSLKLIKKALPTELNNADIM